MKKVGKTLSALLVMALMVSGCGAAEEKKQSAVTSGGSVQTESAKKEGQAMNLKDAFGKDFKVGKSRIYTVSDVAIDHLCFFLKS